MKKLFLFLLILITGCTNTGVKNAETAQKKHSFSFKKWQGNWLIKDYFDKLNSGTYAGSVNTSGYGITEIKFDSAHHDSLWLFSEDDYILKVPFKVVGDDSILVRINFTDSSSVSFHEKTGTLDIKSFTSARHFAYFHAADSLLNDSVPKSAFRKALNGSLARTPFIVYDPNLDQPHGTNASLDCLGKVKGVKNFKTYRVFVNPARSNCRDVDRIDFSDGKKISSFGLVLVRNGIFLYRLNLYGKNTGKPYYQKGSFFLELDRPAVKAQGHKVT